MKERSKLPLLLTELSVMLLIFAVCAAICLSGFAASRRTARESGELGNAAVRAQSAAEAYRAANGNMKRRRPSWRRLRAGGSDQVLTGTGTFRRPGGRAE
jgi:type II secretory pathway pseudopilin PulG